jgi:hypothetical protein
MMDTRTFHVDLTPASPEDVFEMGDNIRVADRLECWAAGHIWAEEAIMRGLASSTRTWTARADGLILAVLGIEPVSAITGLGRPWMIGTEALETYAIATIRASRPALTIMHQMYPRLENWVDARNLKSIRWLRWLGFKVYTPKPWGVEGMPFHRFTRGL